VKIAHLADLHITEGPRLDDQRDVLARIIDDARRLGPPDLWIIAGDLTGRAVPHRPSPAERAVLEPALVQMAEIAPVVVVAGNHDHTMALLRLADLGGIFPIQVFTIAAAVTVSTPAGPVEIYALPYPTKRWLLAGQDAPRGVAETREAVSAALAALLRAWAGRVAEIRAEHPTRQQIGVGHFNVAGSRTAGGEILAAHEIELSRTELEALDVDYGALGHIHLNQRFGNWYYPGSPWRLDFGEIEPLKQWHMVEINGYTEVLGHDTHCRAFVTFTYRWAADDDDSEPRWTARPTPGQLAEVPGAEVRLRVTMPETWAASVPLADEVERIEAAGAHRIIIERIVEPVLRVRAPSVASAATIPEKIAEYWQIVASPPNPTEQIAGFEALETLDLYTDGEIHERRGTGEAI